MILNADIPYISTSQNDVYQIRNRTRARLRMQRNPIVKTQEQVRAEEDPAYR